MEGKSKDFFWPSYVDLMTALFAVVLVVFVLTYFGLNTNTAALKKKTDSLRIQTLAKDSIIAVNRKDAALLRKVQANLKLFQSAPGLFVYNKRSNRIELLFKIEYRTGYQFYKIIPQHIAGDFDSLKTNLDGLANKLRDIINTFRAQKKNDPDMSDISYLMVISGSASHMQQDNDTLSATLSYNRAVNLYRYMRDVLKIDFDADDYHDIIELQISGVGFGGIDRFNPQYNVNNKADEIKNQRFIISIAPKIGIGK